MEEEPIGSSPISLSRLFPWIRLVRCVGISLDARSMILATAGVVLLFAGWRGLDSAFGPPFFSQSLNPDVTVNGPAGPWSIWSAGGLTARPFQVLSSPFVQLFAMQPGFRGFSHAALAAVWCAVVWGIVGGAISRVAALRIARGERVGISTATRFALARSVGLIGAPLSPFIAIGFFATLCGLMGLLYRIPGPIGATIAGIFAFLPLIAGFVMALIVVGMAVGWPLMTATVAVEGEDAFDALSRAYSYVYQRPAQYAFYAAVAWAVGWAGNLVVWAFAALTIHLAEWGLAFGGPADQVVSLFGEGNTAAPTATAIHSLWIYAIRWIAYAWLFSYFWTAATMIYFFLRHEVDGASFHDVAGSNETEDTFIPDSPEFDPAKTVNIEAPATES